MEELRIDCLHQTAEELDKAKVLKQHIFSSESYDARHGRIL